MASILPPLPPVLPNVGSSGQSTSDKPTNPPVAPSSGDLVPARLSTFRIERGLRGGAWLATFRPSNAPLTAYDGTVRVEVHPSISGGGRTTSGDLYQRPIHHSPGTITPVLGAGPNPQDRIPIQPLSRYRYYLSITKILEGLTFEDSFEMDFNRWKYTPHATAEGTGNWTSEGAFKATLAWTAPPAGFPSDVDYLSGDVQDSAGIVIGSLNLGWVSEFLRKVTIEIDSVDGIERPLHNGLTGVNHFDWQKVFSNVSWDLTVFPGQNDVPPPAPDDDGWSDAELHAGMLRWRNSANLDTEWRFHLLCVKKIDTTPRGIMYDALGTDSDNLPREGAAVATSWIIARGWGRVSGRRFGAVPEAYFRAAVHEIGHALSLVHNLRNQYFMDTSDTIAAAGEQTQPSFPDNIKWGFTDDDARRLKHWPDAFVRPGGSPFGSSNTAPTMSPPDNAVELPNIELSVMATLGEVPLGAPVRLELSLRNSAGEEGSRVQVPADIGLRSGFIQGMVAPATGAPRSFRSIVISDGGAYKILAPGDEIIDSVTLLRGAEGALFPSSGLYDVKIEVKWDLQDAVASVIGSTTVLVTGPKDASHAAAAHKLLTSPDAHLVMVLGGDHLDQGVAAIQAALQDDTLRPHFVAIEAKLLATRFQNRKPDVEAAKQLIDGKSILTNTEKQKLQKLLV